MVKKVRLSIPSYCFEVLEKDMQYLEMSKDSILNLIIRNLGFETRRKPRIEVIDNKRIIIFNMNKNNTDLFPSMILQSSMQNESEFIRSILIEYANLHPFLREKLLRIHLFRDIEFAISKKKCIKIQYQKEIKDIQPIDFQRDEESFYTTLRAKENGREFLYEVRFIEILQR